MDCTSFCIKYFSIYTLSTVIESFWRRRLLNIDHRTLIASILIQYDLMIRVIMPCFLEKEIASGRSMADRHLKVLCTFCMRGTAEQM